MGRITHQVEDHPGSRRCEQHCDSIRPKGQAAILHVPTRAEPPCTRTQDAVCQVINGLKSHTACCPTTVEFN